jgi:chemotaxis methyl-accepting protein methylase
MRARNAASYADYAAILDRDPKEYEHLLDALTINVTKFFRNWPTFESVARNVVPALWATVGPIRVWSAGSSSGEEAYSIAAMFYQHALSIGQTHRISRVSVLGSDIDRASLEAAEKAVYPQTAFSETPEELVGRYFEQRDEMRTVIPIIRQLVRFERRDILREPPPANIFELIVCRNVIIYFDRPAQEELFGKFHRVLAPGGYLLLGRVETLLGQPRTWFTPVDLRERIFRKTE